MVVLVERGADVEGVRRELVRLGLWTRRLEGEDGVRFLIDPASARVAVEEVERIRGVAAVAVEPSAHPRVDAQPPVVEVAGVRIGAGAAPVLMAGPCSVESSQQVDAVAARLASLGVRFLRGGAFKTRTSPYTFQGHGEAALGWLRDAADAHGLRVVTEALAAEHADRVAAHADLIQIGSRNMQSSALLRAVAAQGRPVLLKRGMAATIEEWLLAGEYCLLHGAPAVIFCERGIRGFDPSTRNVLDLGAVALLSSAYHQPVMVDPSHAAGRRDLVLPLARAALAAGAGGVLVETHDDPGLALSDGPQALPPEQMAALATALLTERSRASDARGVPAS